MSTAQIWIVRSLYAMPLLWIVGALFWLVPLLGPHAPGHALYVVPLVAWPFLVLLALGSLRSLLLARANEFESLRRARPVRIGGLQALLLAIFVIGSIPMLTFNIAPEQSIAATAVQTPLGMLAAASIVTEWVLLSRRRAFAPPRGTSSAPATTSETPGP